MIEFWIGVICVLMAVWGGVISVHPPQERQSKIVSGTVFGAAGLLLIALLWIHTSDNAKEKQEAATVQQESRAILIQTQKEFRDFRGEVVEATKRAQQPGTSDERLNSVLDGLNKTL